MGSQETAGGQFGPGGGDALTQLTLSHEAWGHLL